MISVLVPAYNEAARIAATLAAIKTLPYRMEIIVADDGSTDGTAQIALRAGAERVLALPHQGKGAALQAAFQESQYPILLLLDSDLGETASHASMLVQPVLDDELDMSIAKFARDPNARPGGSGRVVKLVHEAIRKETGREFASPLSGQRAVKREVVEAVGGFASGWGVEAILTLDALNAGYRVEEIEAPFRHRVTGRDLQGILHRFHQYREISKALNARKSRT